MDVQALSIVGLAVISTAKPFRRSVATNQGRGIVKELVWLPYSLGGEEKQNQTGCLEITLDASFSCLKIASCTDGEH